MRVFETDCPWGNRTRQRGKNLRWFSPLAHESCWLWLSLFFFAACSLAEDRKPEEKPKMPTPFADRVVMFQRGSGGGNGEDQLPNIVLGPPQGAGKLKSSTHVLSIGQEGSITLEFPSNTPSPDHVTAATREFQAEEPLSAQNAADADLLSKEGEVDDTAKDGGDSSATK